jgi:cardiolipin synthase
MLDPLADKVFISFTTVALAHAGLLPVWLVATILGRDAVLIAGVHYMRWKTKPPDADFYNTTHSAKFEVQASTISKVNTVLQFSTAGFAVLNAAHGIPGDALLEALG